MGNAIHFDHQPRVTRVEIGNIGTNRVLSAEFYP